MADRHDRGAMAAAHARSADDAYAITEPAAQIFEELHGAGQLATQTVADPYCQRRRRRLVVHDDVEMGVERGDLVDLDECEPHLLGECGEMARIEATEMVLQQMQVLDQQITPPFTGVEQRLHLTESGRVDLAPLRVIRPATAPRARMDAAIVLYRRRHRSAPSPSPPFRGEREGPARGAGG